MSNKLMKKKVCEVFNTPPQQGLLGVEIEMEAVNSCPVPFPRKDLPFPWKGEDDNSLRGNSVEYVMKVPQDAPKAFKSVTAIYDLLKMQDIEVRDSFRAGVHVHVNCQDMTMQELFGLILLYTSFEEVLTKWCGENRVGNLFCLRSRDAEYFAKMVGESFQKGDFDTLYDNYYRYSSLNLCSLPKYGSAEFRALGTPTKPDRIIKWASALVELKNRSKHVANPMDVFEEFSMLGAEKWAENILGETFCQEVKEANGEDFEHALWRGMRQAQDIFFYYIC